jgi:cytoskeletal protein RodZ
MKKDLRKFSVITLIFLMLMFLTILSSCGSTIDQQIAAAGLQNSTTGQLPVADQQVSTSDQLPVSDQQADSSSTDSSAEQSTLSAVDTAASADDLIGTWKDANDDTQTAKITKTDSGYELEQSDGKYPATFANGVLKVKATDTDTADVYIDKQTGHLILSYQGGITEYVK